MEKRFILEGDIDAVTVENFKTFLRTVGHRETIYMRIKSYGGNVFSGIKIGNFIRVMKKYKQCTFIMEGEKFHSAALKIFLRGDKRIIQRNPSSDAAIHLPVVHKNKKKSPEEKEKEEQTTIVLIQQLPHLSESEIRSLNNIPLTVAFMLEKGIATECIEYFPVL